MFGLFKRGGSRRRFRSRKNRNLRRRTFRSYRGGSGGPGVMDLKGVRNTSDLPGSTGSSTFNPGHVGTGASQYHKPF